MTEAVEYTQPSEINLMIAFSIIYCLTTPSTKAQCLKCFKHGGRFMFRWFHCAGVTRMSKRLTRSPVYQRRKIQQQLDGRGQIRRAGKKRQDNV